MKKLFFAIVVLIVALSVNAQDYKPFKVDLAVGYAIPGGKGAKGGVLFALEPKYAVMDKLVVGLRMEAAVVARGYAGTNVEDEMEVDVKASGSYLATADYFYSGNHKFRAFSGIGTGIYTIAGASVSSGSETVAVGSDSKFGGLVRSGIKPDTSVSLLSTTWFQKPNWIQEQAKKSNRRMVTSVSRSVLLSVVVKNHINRYQPKNKLKRLSKGSLFCFWQFVLLGFS